MYFKLEFSFSFSIDDKNTPLIYDVKFQGQIENEIIIKVNISKLYVLKFFVNSSAESVISPGRPSSLSILIAFVVFMIPFLSW